MHLGSVEFIPPALDGERIGADKTWAELCADHQCDVTGEWASQAVYSRVRLNFKEDLAQPVRAGTVLFGEPPLAWVGPMFGVDIEWPRQALLPELAAVVEGPRNFA